MNNWPATSLIKIIGQGVWGQALLALLKRSGRNVSFYETGEKLTDVALLLLAVPVAAVRSVLTGLGSVPAELLLVNTAKGLEEGSGALPNEIASAVLGDHQNYFTLAGPTFAAEVQAGQPAVAGLGYRSAATAATVQAALASQQFQLQLTDKLAWLELAAAFKNIYALVLGLAVGLGLGQNVRAALFARALTEFATLGEKVGAPTDPAVLATALGDFVLTAYNPESRNYCFGELLATHSLGECQLAIKETVEGVNAALAVPVCAEKYLVTLPLASLVGQLIQSDDHSSWADRLLALI